MNLDKRKNKKAIFLRILKLIIIYSIISAILVGLTLLWQNEVTLLSLCNAFYMSGTLLLAFAVMVLSSNNNIFSPLIYSVRAFFTMFSGKKMDTTYYDYTEKIKESPIPKRFIVNPLIFSIPNFIVAIILNIML